MSDSPSPVRPSAGERQLREALETLAAGVRPAPNAYRVARSGWLRRERRRRMVLAALIIVLFTLVTLIGLWVLNRAPADPGVIFDDTVPAQQSHSTAHPGTR